VRLCRDLVTLERNAPVGLDPKDCRVRPPDRAKLEGLLTRFEFHSLLPEMLPTETTAVDRRVAVVDSEAALRALVKTLSSARELAVDVETTGTDCFRCDLVGIALAVKPGQAWYIPVGHNYLGCPSQLPLKTVIQELAPFFEDEKLPKTGQNLKFDDLVLRRQDVRLRGISFDTLIASYCLNPSRMTHGLKELARDMLGETMTAIDELIGKGAKQITMDKVEIGPTAQYAAADAEVVLRLKQKMEGLLDERGTKSLFHDVEMPLVGILADMEESGVRVDVKYLQKLQTEFGADIAAIEKEIFDLAGQPLNLNSPKQLSTLLFEKLKLPVIRRTKTGFSTDEEVLRKLGAQHPLPAKLLDYRELSKLKSTYIDALLTLVHPETGRVHTSFNQAVTATGRLSSSDPNLQNIPIRTEHGRRIRRAFVPDKGSVFLSADYSQIDLRVLAHVSQDPVLCEAFRRGEDIHSATAVEIFGLKRGVSPSSDQRRIAKTVNFGIVYGKTAYGLSQQIGLPPHEAQNFIDRYFRRYAGVKKWIESIIEQARRQGCVTTLLNRVRYLPEIQAPNASVRAFAERTAMNTPIQGTSADIIKVAMRDAVAALKENGFKTRLLVQVHDELLFETPQKELARAARLIREKMEKALHLAVPLIVDLKIGPNWSDMEKTEE
jgi:DNA polymerase I